MTERREDLGAKHQFHGVQPVLPVKDVASSVAYFCDVLGFDVDFLVGDPPIHGRVTKGDRSYRDPVYIHLTVAPPEGVQPCGEIRIHVGHDLDGLYSAYQALDVNTLGEPQSQPWGLREFSVRDPNGHQICFCGFLSSATDSPTGSTQNNDHERAILQAVHPVLPSRNVKASIEFYTTRLGFSLQFKDSIEEPRYAGLRRDDVEIHVQWHDAAEWDAVERPSLRFIVPVVQILFEEYQRSGVLPEGAEVRETPWGTREFAFFDPDQNRLTFYCDK